MSFFDILKELVEGVRGGVGAAVMGVDGLSVQQYSPSSDQYDVEAVGIEYGHVIDEIKNASTLLNLGEVEEITVTTLGRHVLLRMIASEYYMAMVVGHDANIGKARYMLKKAAQKAAKELST